MRRDRFDIGPALGLLALVLPWIVIPVVVWIVVRCAT